MGVFITICIFLTIMGTATTLSSTPHDMTVYVAGDGKGDFNCDGIDDQIEINEALVYVADRITSYNVCYTKLLRATASPSGVSETNM